MTKHTPLPWESRLRVNEANYPYTRWVVYGPEMEYVATCDAVGEGQDEKNETNAEFIVRACNSHDDLLAALEDIGRHNARGALAEESEWLAFLPKQSQDAIAKVKED